MPHPNYLWRRIERCKDSPTEELATRNMRYVNHGQVAKFPNAATDPPSEGSRSHVIVGLWRGNLGRIIHLVVVQVFFRSDTLATGRMAELQNLVRDRGPLTPSSRRTKTRQRSQFLAHGVDLETRVYCALWSLHRSNMAIECSSHVLSQTACTVWTTEKLAK